VSQQLVRSAAADLFLAGAAQLGAGHCFHRVL
jgi:hypothetical protein